MSSMDIRNKLMRLHPNLLNYAFMLTSSRDAAKDLLKETTAMALTAGTGASVDDENLKGWAFGIMRSIFEKNFSQGVSRQRSVTVSSRRECDIHELSFSRIGDESLPEGTYACSEVTCVLEGLSEEYRKPAEMYFAGYSMKEIAQRLNISTCVAEQRVSYSKGRLRAGLAK